MFCLKKQSSQLTLRAAARRFPFAIESLQHRRDSPEALRIEPRRAGAIKTRTPTIAANPAFFAVMPEEAANHAFSPPRAGKRPHFP
jgi:hypothetical protein